MSVSPKVALLMAQAEKGERDRLCHHYFDLWLKSDKSWGSVVCKERAATLDQETTSSGQS